MRIQLIEKLGLRTGTGVGLKWSIAFALTILVSAANSRAQTNYVQLKAFDAADVLGSPSYGLIEGGNGALYGTAAYGGVSNGGTVYRLNKDGGAMLVLHSFRSVAADGQTPMSELAESPEAVLYGTTAYGGMASGLGYGTVFKLKHDGSEYTILHRFGISGTDGKYPVARLIFSDGVLFGMTSDGGSNGNGTLFRIDADGSNYRVIRSFAGATSEARPCGGLIKGSDGFLYGMVSYAGNNNFSGGIFRINPDGLEYSVLHRLSATGQEGVCPSDGIIEGTDGRLYGTTINGGTAGDGVVFQLNKDGSGFAVLHNFSISNNGGASPNRLVEGANGMLYGTASIGGAYSGGTAFKIKKDGSGYTVMWTFGRFRGDGLEPCKSLLCASNGATYGTTAAGGISNSGTIFALFQQPQSWFTGQLIEKNAVVSFQALGAANLQYRLLAATNLAMPAWLAIATNTATPTGILSFTNLPAQLPPLFYRIAAP